MADESDVIRVDLASDISEGEAARKKLEEIGDQVEQISPAFDRARDANGRFTSSLTEAEKEARKVAEAMKQAEAAARSAASVNVGRPDGGGSGYALERDTYDVGLPHRVATDAIAKEQQGFDRLTAAMHAHEAAARTDAAAVHRLGDEATRAGRALDTVHAGKLQGADRAGAFSRAGLLGLNTAQDMIQGGPASGINNILGAANDRGIKSLAGEFVSAAGGAKVLAAGIGTIALAAGAAFLAIDQGLSSNKLGWSDLGDVIDEMTGGVISKTGKVWGETLGGIADQVKGVVGTIAEVAIGWNSAAEAVRAHKDEVERNTAAVEAYEKAAKAVAGIKSDAQLENEKNGKVFGNELANLDPKGAGAVLDKLARAQAEARGDADKEYEVESNVIGKDGKPTGETRKEKLTGTDIARRALTQDLANAAGGDKASMEGLAKRLAAAGFDTKGLDAAMAGRDPGKEKKEADAAKQKDSEDAQARAEKDAKEKSDAFYKRSNDLARPLQDAFNVQSASGIAPDRASVARDLKKGGLADKEADAQAGAVLDELRENFAAAIRKKAGEKQTDAQGAAAAIVQEAVDKQAKDARAKADQAEAKQDKDRRDAVEKADKAAGGTNLGGRVDDALLRSSLKAGGDIGEAARAVAEQIKRELMARGLNAEEAGLAAEDIAKKHADKLGDEVSGPGKDRSPGDKHKELATPQHIAGADFARSVEGAGAVKAEDKLVNLNETMKDRLTDLVRLVQRGPVLQ